MHEGHHRRGVQVSRGRQQVVADTINGEIERHDAKGQEDVNQYENNGEFVVQHPRKRLIDDPGLKKKAVDDPGISEKRQPGIAADDIIDPIWREQNDEKKKLVAGNDLSPPRLL